MKERMLLWKPNIFIKDFISIFIGIKESSRKIGFATEKKSLDVPFINGTNKYVKDNQEELQIGVFQVIGLINNWAVLITTALIFSLKIITREGKDVVS